MSICTEKTDLLVIALLGTIGLIAFVAFHEIFEPFPIPDYRHSRNQALDAATDYLGRLGFDTTPYHRAAFYNDDRGNWTVRFLRELQEGQFYVDVDESENVGGFIHRIADSAQGADLAQTDALTIAQAFIVKQGDVSLANTTLVSATTTKKESRTDHTFKWTISGEDPDLRLAVTVHGSVIDGYRYSYVDATDSGPTDLAARFFLTNVSGYLESLITLVAVVTLLIALIQGVSLPWRGAIALALIMALITLVQELNRLPARAAFYDAASSLYAYWQGEGSYSLRVVSRSSAQTLLFALAGWSVCRHVFGPEHGTWLTTPRYWGSPQAARASFTGYAIAAVWLGGVGTFYLIGAGFFETMIPSSWFGHSDLRNTWVPEVVPLTTSMEAAVSEELIYRYFAITLLLRYLKWRFLSVLIPSMIWGFGHYTELSPYYLRGIELTLFGTFVGYCFLRFGLIAVITAHYVYDAVVGVVPFLYTSNTSFVVIGGGTISAAALPMVLALMRALNARYVFWQTPVARSG